MPESEAERIAKRILGRDCYGKQYGDHGEICEVCRWSNAITSALAERDESWKLVVKELARVSALNKKLMKALGMARLRIGNCLNYQEVVDEIDATLVLAKEAKP